MSTGMFSLPLHASVTEFVVKGLNLKYDELFRGRPDWKMMNQAWNQIILEGTYTCQQKTSLHTVLKQWQQKTAWLKWSVSHWQQQHTIQCNVKSDTCETTDITSLNQLLVAGHRKSMCSFIHIYCSYVQLIATSLVHLSIFQLFYTSASLHCWQILYFYCSTYSLFASHLIQ